MVFGVVAGMLYGVYSSFLTLGMDVGHWVDWKAGLSAFTVVYVLASLGAALNDSLSALWALLIMAVRGKLPELVQTLRSRAGAIVVAAAVIGGPIASTSYVVALQTAGSIIIPITALCPAFGAILGKVFLKQPLTWLMGLGVSVCVAAGVLIGISNGVSEDSGSIGLGIAFALIAALGWGIEGCLGGFVTANTDPGVSIAIRQAVAGAVNLFLLLPLLCLIGGDVALAPKLALAAFTSWPEIALIAVSALAAYLSWALWYKGNALCGTALGMACDATYSFWGPLACWVLLGIVIGQDGWNLPPVAWLGAVVMVGGIFVLAIGARRATQPPISIPKRA
jgi:drug/metabolite transporter (DMT)-like permease